MNIFAFFSFFSCIISLSIAIFVYFLKKEDTVNKVFMATIVFNSIWAFTEFMIRQADLASTAYFWVKVSSIGLFPRFLCFILRSSIQRVRY